MHLSVYVQKNKCYGQVVCFSVVTEKWKETHAKREKILQEETGEMNNNICFCTVMKSVDVQLRSW